MFITATGMIVRSPVSEMRSMGRNTQGVRLVNLKDDDQLVAMEIISAVELEEYQQLSAPRRAPVLLEPGAEDIGAEDTEEEVDEAEDEPDDEEGDAGALDAGEAEEE
jgi:DNA gyrase subunit A